MRQRGLVQQQSKLLVSKSQGPAKEKAAALTMQFVAPFDRAIGVYGQWNGVGFVGDGWVLRDGVGWGWGWGCRMIGKVELINMACGSSVVAEMNCYACMHER